MHSRLIFLHHRHLTAKNAERKVTMSSKDGAQASAKAHHRTICREKLAGIIRCPYRKPTQVGESNRLRRARETSLRNSAH